MTTALDVVGFSPVQGPRLLVLDEYVPLRLRTYERPLGASYVRLGNYSTTLLEVVVDPNRNVVRGLTIISYDTLSEWPDLAVVSYSDGLPVLAAVFGPANRIDLKEEFRVSMRKGELLVFWGDLSRCSQIDFAQVHCLVQEGQLRGIRFSGLSDKESELFASHAQRGA